MRNKKSLAFSAFLTVAACTVFAEDSALALTNAYRTSVGDTMTYRTGSVKTSVELPDQLKKYGSTTSADFIVRKRSACGPLETRLGILSTPPEALNSHPFVFMQSNANISEFLS